MSKWKAPTNAGPSVSVGGQTFNIVDGVVELPDEGSYAAALIPFGFEAIPTTWQEAAEAEAKRLAVEEAAAAEAVKTSKKK